MRRPFTRRNKCLYKSQLVRSAYLHMNRVRPIEKSLNDDGTERGERERTTKEAGGGLRINHNRLQSEAPFFFLHFSSLVPLNQSHTSSSSSSMMMMLHFSLSLRPVRSR